MTQEFDSHKNEYSEIYNLPTLLICVIDPQGNFLRTNQAQFHILGWPPEELLGKPVANFVHQDDAERTAKEIGAAIASNALVTDFRNRCLHRNGGYRWISWTGRARSGYVYAAGTDVTEEVESKQKLEEAVRIRDEFLSLASHELNTPLTALKLQAQLRARNVNRGNMNAFTSEKLSQMVESDMRQIDRLARLVTDMLDISRISTGRLVMHPEPCNLVEIIEETVSRFASQAAEIGISISISGFDQPIEGHWDRIRIEQVVANLLSNALKYGNHKPVTIKISRNEHTARLEVQDRGIGIEKDNQARIFERFERAGGATHATGLGLGLYIVKKILHMHGGSIKVESEPGTGSTFIVELPLT